MSRPSLSPCSVIDRVRYIVEVQSLSGRWDDVEIRDTEEAARLKEAEWREWLTTNNKSWRDVRILKETVIHEVLPNTGAQATTPAHHQQTKGTTHHG